MGTLVQELRYAARTLGKSKGYTAMAVLTLALCIGATSTIFTALNTIVLRPLPYPSSSRLAHIYSVNPGFKDMRVNMSLGDMPDLRARTHSFEDLAEYESSVVNLSGEGEPEQLAATKASPEFFRMLGQRPQRGRFFDDRDIVPGHDGVAILSDALWRRRFAADESVLGRKLLFDGLSYTVVGVASPTFHFLAGRTDVWTPLAPTGEQRAARGRRWCSVLALMRQGVSLDQANADLGALSSILSKEFPDTNRDWTFTAVPLHDELVGDVRSPLYVLFCGVTFLLVIGCTNIANLSLVRNWTRRRTTAICAALGATRGQIVRQVLLESSLVALLGGTVGVGLAVWGLDLVRRMAPLDTPRLDQLRPDWALVGFTAACSVLVGMFFGLAPALQSAGLDVNRTLRSDDRFGAGFSRGVRRWFSHALLTCEAALTVVLLVGAGLMLQSFARLTRVQTGLHTEKVLSLSMLLPAGRYPDEARQAAFARDAIERVKALPGVESVAATSNPVLQGSLGIAWGIHVKGEYDRADGYSNIESMQVTADYFQTFGLPVRAGRSFNDADDQSAAPVAIVNESLARLIWGKANPIGKELSFGGGRQLHWREVVGVVADARDVYPDEVPRPEVYTPFLQNPGQIINMAVRTSGDSMAFVPAVRQAIWSLDSNEPVTGVQTIETAVATYETAPRFRTILLTTFAALGLALAMVGIYGVVSYATAQRTHEIGVRAALGAKPAQILREVLLRGMTPIFAGSAIGIAAAFALGKTLASLLYEVKPTDPVAMTAGVLTVVAVSLVSCYAPARRATRVDPLVALRYE